MGSDDLFHKRKARESAELERQQKTRARSPRYLIVCEGTKTEPNYFRELLIDLNVLPQSVRIARNEGTSPDRIVEHAQKIFVEDAVGGDCFDKVFCVFDRDTHTTFDAAVQMLNNLNSTSNTQTYEAITSNPCFEYWFLLHFGFTDKPFHAAGKKSIGDQVVSTLRRKPGFKNYGKGDQGTYSVLKNMMDSALASAKKVRECAKKTGQGNPSTSVDLLIVTLQNLAHTERRPFKRNK